MSKIQWAELADKDKIALVLEHVMGWQWSDTATDYYDAFWTQEAKYVEISHPFALWDGGKKQWTVFASERGYDDCGRFDPLNDMGAAWSVLLKMVDRLDLSAGKRKEFKRYEVTALEMLFDSYGPWGEIYPAFDILNLIREWTPEQICIAALKATGLETENDASD